MGVQLTVTVVNGLPCLQKPQNINRHTQHYAAITPYRVPLLLDRVPRVSARRRRLKKVLGSIGALIIRIGFWCPLSYKYNKEPPQNSIGNYLGLYSNIKVSC